MKRSRGVIFGLMVALGACVSGWAGVGPFATIVRGGNDHYLISKWETEEGLPENLPSN